MRLSLFEFGDLAWAGKTYHYLQTDFLEYYYNAFNLYQPAYSKIEKLIHKTNVDTIIDLCSGAGGPVVRLRQYLDHHQLKHIPIVLTDITPNIPAFQNLEKHFPAKIIGHLESVDATNIPPKLKGLRTFFTAFHHFPKSSSARKLLQDAIDHEMPIGIFEVSERSLQSIFYAFLSLFSLSVLLIAQMRPFSWKKFFWTYVIPIYPIMMSWDYLASCLRTYSVTELQALVDTLETKHYQFEIGKCKGWHGLYRITYLIGYKKEK